MPFVTTLTLRSGDRAALDSVVGGLQQAAERKGVDCRGPHTRPPETYRVPLFRRLTGEGGEFAPWEYTVYERELRLAGHDGAVRRLADWGFPRGVHVEVTVDRVRSVGSD